MDRARIMSESRRRYDGAIDIFKKWWHIAAIVFGTGIAWGAMRTQVEDHERRIVRLESIPQDLQEIKDLIRRRNRHDSEN